MKCSKCQNDINKGQEVCLNCGHILGYESELSKKCRHCNREIPINYKKCPFCKKKQNSKKGLLTTILIIITILINIYIFYNLYGDNYLFNNNYKTDCLNLTYEEIVRKNTYYDEAYITLKGRVISVNKISLIGNRIEIKLYVEDNKDNIIFVRYNNIKSTGFMKDDVTIYGKFKSLNGNIPIINAHIIE
jgi:RNA polymerase subunit RPABC4/transcription elongation factor Spt4